MSHFFGEPPKQQIPSRTVRVLQSMHAQCFGYLVLTVSCRLHALHSSKNMHESETKFIREYPDQILCKKVVVGEKMKLFLFTQKPMTLPHAG